MAKANVYEMVTERIIAELEKGIIPWEKLWTGVRDGAFKRGFDSRHQLYFLLFYIRQDIESSNFFGLFLRR